MESRHKRQRFDEKVDQAYTKEPLNVPLGSERFKEILPRFLRLLQEPVSPVSHKTSPQCPLCLPDRL
ncbi:hypothetical protein TNCV_2773861 [Trichonephila clavipes]|nr:hypothetical protein TNCV_2773861 [Trichonephila clavipes]